MFPSLVLSIGLIAACVVTHYEALRVMNDALPGLGLVRQRQKVLVAIFGALGSHLAQISLFATAFYVLHHTFGIGLIGGQFDDRFATYVYFSAETYTSLGFGDIYPAGEIRILAGAEALTGLLMISWSASFSYLEMRRFW